jgi:hypothetical protein
MHHNKQIQECNNKVKAVFPERGKVCTEEVAPSIKINYNIITWNSQHISSILT